MKILVIVAAFVASVVLTLGHPGSGGVCCTTSPRPVLAIDIMPLGDSITQGDGDWESQGGYRGRLEGVLLPKYHAVWRGSITDAQGRKHEGHSGWKIQQLTPNVGAWITPTHPHWVLLHIGSNNAGAGESSSQMLAELATLLDAIHAASPASQVVLAQIPEIPINPASENASLRDYNAGMPGLVSARADWVRLVDQTHSEVGPDGVHMSPTGYGRMANVWRAVWPT